MEKTSCDYLSRANLALIFCYMSMAMAVLATHSIEWIRGPKVYEASDSTKPLYCGRGDFIKVSGRIVDIIDVSTVEKVNNVQAGSSSSNLYILQHESGSLIPVESGSKAYSIDDTIDLVGRLKPTFPSLYNDFCNDPSLGELSRFFLRTLNNNDGRKLVAPIVSLIIIAMLGLWTVRHRASRLQVSVEENAQSWGRRTPMFIIFMFTAVPLPIAVYYSSSFFQILAIAGGLGAFILMVKSAEASYISIDQNGVLVERLLNNTWIEWGEVDAADFDYDEDGRPNLLLLQQKDGVFSISLDNLFYHPIATALIVDRVKQYVEELELDDHIVEVIQKLKEKKPAYQSRKFTLGKKISLFFAILSSGVYFFATGYMLLWGVFIFGSFLVLLFVPFLVVAMVMADR